MPILTYLNGFVIDIHPYDCDSSHLLCLRHHFANGCLSRLPQGSFVTGRPLILLGFTVVRLAARVSLLTPEA